MAKAKRKLSYSVTAYYPASWIGTDQGVDREKTIGKLAKSSAGRPIGGGTMLTGARPLRDLQFGFYTRADATRFLNKLKTRGIRRSGVSQPKYW